MVNCLFGVYYLLIHFKIDFNFLQNLYLNATGQIPKFMKQTFNIFQQVKFSISLESLR